MVLDDLPNLEDIYTSLCSSTVEDSEMDFDSGLEDDDSKSDSILEDSTIFVAFKGNIDDKDFKWKLDTILENVPNLLHMGAGFPGGSVVKNAAAMQEAQETQVQFLGRQDPSPGGRNGNPFQYSCLGNPMDRGAWQATVHGVAKELDMTE